MIKSESKNILKLVLLARIALLIATIITLIFAFLPNNLPHIHHFPTDKINHFMAFLCLATISLAAYPKLHILILSSVWIIAGLGIEIIQGFPFIGRDRELLDWLVEIFAIFLVNSIYFASYIRIKAQNN